jgi:hypothetical protein
MASRYTAGDPAAYQRLMGRWSGRLAEQLISFAGNLCDVVTSDVE